MKKLTHDRAQEMLNYDPSTGVFTWRKKPNRNIVVGSIVGSYDKDGYLETRLDREPLKIHRLAWFYVHGVWPDGDIDHKNGIRADNRIDNLRDVTASENQCNRHTGRPNKSGFRGVVYHSKTGRWTSRLMVKGKSYSFGYHDSPQEASVLYEAAAKELKGEFYPGPQLTAAA